MKVDVCFARFPFGAKEHPAGVDWLLGTVLAASKDERIGKVDWTWEDDTPITMSRNKVLKKALAHGTDLLVMLDSDMGPDSELGRDPNAKPFWQSSFDHWWQHYKNQPCCIFAPYCGPPPHEIPFIFQWCTFQGGHPNPDWRLAMFSREEAAMRTGFEIVGAGPTGLILIDMRAIKMLPKPWFDYEWKDEERTIKASTEDVVFTRDLSMLGVPQIVNWDAWAIHFKTKQVHKPGLMTVESIAERMREPLLAARRPGERVRVMSEKDLPPELMAHIKANGEVASVEAS